MDFKERSKKAKLNHKEFTNKRGKGSVSRDGFTGSPGSQSTKSQNSMNHRRVRETALETQLQMTQLSQSLAGDSNTNANQLKMDLENEKRRNRILEAENDPGVLARATLSEKIRKILLSITSELTCRAIKDINGQLLKNPQDPRCIFRKMLIVKCKTAEVSDLNFQ